ncbi:MAG TPA: peptidoglycan editing factor PgeF [Candidatus Angelobacter sp.]
MMTMMTTALKPTILRAANLENIPWLVHGFSTRSNGTSKSYGGKSLNLGFTKEDARESVETNRSFFLQAVGAADRGKPWPLISLRQIHSDVIHVVSSPKPARLVGDGLITNLPWVALGILTADCFPVLLVDTRNKAVGAFHAGWRGTVQRIAEKGVGVMRREYGTRPEDLRAAIGPGIHKCCYAIGEEVRSQFESQFDYAGELFHEQYSPDPIREKYPLLFLNARPPGHGDTATRMYLDIMEANQRQLLKVGVPEEQISVLAQCTSCDTRKFFSHRAERGQTGRMMALIGIKS